MQFFAVIKRQIKRKIERISLAAWRCSHHKCVPCCFAKNAILFLKVILLFLLAIDALTTVRPPPFPIDSQNNWRCIASIERELLKLCESGFDNFGSSYTRVPKHTHTMSLCLSRFYELLLLPFFVVEMITLGIWTYHKYSTHTHSHILA